jgi:hypothetical protein
MTTKPTGEPLTPARLLTTAKTLEFRPTARDRSGSTLGVLVDAAAHRHLAITAEGAWTVASALPKGLDPVLLYESAANVLRGGEPNSDGSVSYQGSSYVIEPRFDGSSWTVKLRGTT